MAKREGDKIYAEFCAERESENKKKKYQSVYEARANMEGQVPLKGVRFRKWGSCVAELPDPFTKRRVWLGTFRTVEEANAAVLAKQEEFRQRKEVQAHMDQTRPISVSGSERPSGEGEGSSRGLGLNEIVIDKNGYLLGEFSTLDDSLNIVQVD